MTPRTSIPPLDEAAIAGVIARFYGRVRVDPELGPVFAAAVPEEAWPAHLARIGDFWSSLTLGTGRYKGDPFGVHVRVDGMRPELFARWLSLFGETCRELLPPEHAAALTEKAERIAESLKAGLFFRPERHPRPDPAVPEGAQPAAGPTAPARRTA